ncbi:hypothetical protein [Nocardia transvalensis]|uniref:hypothetical protein n=1 Tax=Nocardia transvalensis TaxID=37333 RepID=UPI0018960940|nr:hypothetical protein [Nocardia transvalensis]MBF6330602.1 hypothetical protein [Nocardia transvalensis]
MVDTAYRRAKIDEDTQRMTVFPAEGPELDDFPAKTRAGARRTRPRAVGTSHRKRS